MRARQLLPAALALGSLLALSGCANGSGLRVEGAEAPVSSATPSSSAKGFAPEETPSIKVAPEPVAMSLPEVKTGLLADRRLDDYSRKVLQKCTVLSRCLTRGATVDVMHSGKPQLVVLIHTVDSFVFGAFVMASGPSGPRRVWSLKADQLKISPSPAGDLIVESQIFTINDQPCCPSGRRVEVYRWVGGQMTRVSSQDQKGD
jgi:hypothetical protein